MEIGVIGSILGLGYYLSKGNEKKPENIKYLYNVNKNKVPSGKNIYENTRTQQVWNEQQQTANKIFAKGQDSENTNFMIAGPPIPIFNKIDAQEKNLPIEFSGGKQLKRQSEELMGKLDKKKYKPLLEIPVNDVTTNGFDPKDHCASGGWEGISLTGVPIEKSDFKHNNMVPFFGGRVTQNMDEKSYVTKMENFTGQIDNYREKSEVERDSFFKPVANLSNPYGMGNLDGYNRERYIAGNIHNNVAPIEQIRVGPGLNQGYTSEPSGGYQQENKFDYITPKNVDELRVKTNPKVSYEGRVLSGKHVAKPSKVGQVFKNNPDTFYVNTPDRLFTTVGAQTGVTQRPNQVIRYTNRKQTGKRTVIGPAGPTNGSKENNIRPVFKKTKKIGLHKSMMPRNKAQEGKWNMCDYGKKGTNMKTTKRQYIKNRKYYGIAGINTPKNQIYSGDKARPTKKIVRNKRPEGNFQNTGPQAGIVYDPNNVARTTIKEQTENNDYKGNFQNTGPHAGTVYDANNVARTTIKEQTENNDHKGYFQNTNPQAGIVYDSNDIARTTNKETTLGGNYYGSNNQQGKAMKSRYKDKAKKTVKQTTFIEKYLGNMAQAFGLGYLTNKVEAPTTIKETVSQGYSGGAYKEKKGGYSNRDIKAPITQRELTSSVPIVGIKGPGVIKADMSRDNTNNSISRSNREATQVGRTPARQGNKQALGSKDMNMTLNRKNIRSAEKIAERGVMSNKVYNSLPQYDKCMETKEVKQLPNKPLSDRLDGDLLKAFRENPYTQSLDSYAFP